MTMRPRLSWKFILPIAGLIVVTAATLGWFFNGHAKELIVRGLVDRGTSLARSLAYQLEYELQFGTGRT